MLLQFSQNTLCISPFYIYIYINYYIYFLLSLSSENVQFTGGISPAARGQQASFYSHCALTPIFLNSFLRPYQSSVQSISRTPIIGKMVILTQLPFFPSCHLVRCSLSHRTLLRCRGACFCAFDVLNEKNHRLLAFFFLFHE